MDYYFYLTIFTRGELWAVIWLFVFWGLLLVLCGVGHFFVCFWQNNNIAQIIVFGRFGGPEKGYC